MLQYIISITSSSMAKYNSKIDQVKLALDENKNVLKTTLEKTLERDTKLVDLDITSTNLRDEANKFHVHTKTVNREYCCQYYKKTITGMILIAILITIFVLIIWGVTRKN